MQKIVGFSFPTLSQTLDTYLCFAFADHDFNTPPQKKKQQKKGKRDTSSHPTHWSYKDKISIDPWVYLLKQIK